MELTGADRETLVRAGADEEGLEASRQSFAELGIRRTARPKLRSLSGLHSVLN